MQQNTVTVSVTVYSKDSKDTVIPTYLLFLSWGLKIAKTESKCLTCVFSQQKSTLFPCENEECVAFKLWHNTLWEVAFSSIMDREKNGFLQSRGMWDFTQ